MPSSWLAGRARGRRPGHRQRASVGTVWVRPVANPSRRFPSLAPRTPPAAARGRRAWAAGGFAFATSTTQTDLPAARPGQQVAGRPATSSCLGQGSRPADHLASPAPAVRGCTAATAGEGERSNKRAGSEWQADAERQTTCASRGPCRPRESRRYRCLARPEGPPEGGPPVPSSPIQSHPARSAIHTPSQAETNSPPSVRSSLRRPPARTCRPSAVVPDPPAMQQAVSSKAARRARQAGVEGEGEEAGGPRPDNTGRRRRGTSFALHPSTSLAPRTTTHGERPHRDACQVVCTK